jgi:hypothetical protein
MTTAPGAPIALAQAIASAIAIPGAASAYGHPAEHPPRRITEQRGLLLQARITLARRLRPGTWWADSLPAR